MTCVRVLPLCSTGQQVDREGRVGGSAYFQSLGVGMHFADGREYESFPGSTAIQDKSKTFQGTFKPDNFDKGFDQVYKRCA